MSVWRHFADSDAGYLFSLSDSLRIAEAKYPDLLVPVADGTLIIASDYSGQHKAATHEAYAFLVTTDRTLRAWLPLLQEFRERWLPDSRRISFKKLNEPVRWRALPAFLNTVGKLNGNLITILVDKRVGSFVQGGPDAAIKSLPDCFPEGCNLGTAEKMLRLASFVALLVSGLRREEQASNWVSDHDEALDSHDKRERFARLATYFCFGLTGWRNPADHLFCTTESPTAPYWSEDVAAIADLAAGAYCQLGGNLPSFFGVESWTAGISSANVENERARVIGDWLARGRLELKHVLLRLEQNVEGDVRSSAQTFLSNFKSFIPGNLGIF
ncbi:MAG: hypothetical protein P4L72_01535 [Parvibaculum sp.]|uniref:hypothetical protein n=1 Tax=Parvibaculum sp. TaxID=2024848 RepID=UPI00284C1ACC|nr:hypothetical protein [Parvibaculum sp.]MDR3497888.1 hypothetical protein [Parvibaculum sp.]